MKPETLSELYRQRDVFREFWGKYGQRLLSIARDQGDDQEDYETETGQWAEVDDPAFQQWFMDLLKRKYVETHRKIITKFQSPQKLYRYMNVNEAWLNSLLHGNGPIEVGVHWSDRVMDEYHNEGQGPIPIVLAGMVSENSVDVDATVYENKVMHGTEEETTLRKGARVPLVAVKVGDSEYKLDKTAVA